MTSLVEFLDVEKKLACRLDAVPIVLPADGRAPVLKLIEGARSTLLIKMFAFDDQELRDAVLDAHRRAVKVSVMLNPRRTSGGRPNDETFHILKDAGVAVRWTNPKFIVTHEKSMIVDSERAMIGTFNFLPKSFALTRDYGVIITDPASIADMAACFAADWRRTGFNPAPDTPLLWSTANARALMARFIDLAQERLDLQHPKFCDTTILDRLMTAARRGVKVRVLCGGKAGVSDLDMPDTFSSLRILQSAGIKVKRQKKGLRLHSKLIIADRGLICLGSMNIDRASFDSRRELGILLQGGEVARRLRVTFDADWEAAPLYIPPDPLSVLAFEEEDEDEISVLFNHEDVHE